MKVSSVIKLLVSLSVFVIPTSALAQGALETPAAGSNASGIGLVRGWHCHASTIEVQFDGGTRYQAAYGTNRPDTAATCGDSNNGFSLLLNYNELGAGSHTVQVFADNVQFGSGTFQVTTLGAPYITGLAASAVTDVMTLGRQVRLQWNESMQNFAISSVQTLPIDATAMMPLIMKAWSGTWLDPAGSPSGTLDLTVGLDSTATALQVTAMTLTGTPCADAMSSSLPINPNASYPEIAATFTDGSTAVFAGLSPPSLGALIGYFVYTSGSCAGQEGIFQIY